MAGDDKSRILRDAEKYVSQGKVPQAINEYLKVVKADPNDVLTLNTIGDLYLREKKVGEATRYFGQVAESYTRNNFLLKAIAVYKKILTADPGNIDIQGTLAGLFVRQGLNLDARNQYLRLAEALGKAGKTKESIEAYEKVIELDPSSHAVQVQLAERYLADGNRERAHSLFVMAAQAQSKAGDSAAARQSFKRAIELNPVDTESLKGYLLASQQTGGVQEALEQLKLSTAMAPEDAGILAVLGEGYMAAGELESAGSTFRLVISQDPKRFPLYFSLSNAFLEAGNLDSAASCMDPILPILITERASDRAVEAYERILKADPGHELTLNNLAAIYSSTNEHRKYLDTQERLVVLYREANRNREALDKVESILSMRPDNPDYVELHQQLYEEVFPGTTYNPPRVVLEGRGTEEEGRLPEGQAVAPDRQPRAPGSDLLEIDLLINYGMKEKALGLLTVMESQNPADTDIRTRLLDIYKDSGQDSKAAEQCIALAVIHWNVKDEEAVSRFLAEARRLSPDIADSERDLVTFAAAHGIPLERGARGPEPHGPQQEEGLELDLSGDLSEIFFKDTGEPSVPEDVSSEPGAIVEDYPTKGRQRASAQVIQEHLQEVDFYIRLGFHDEARTKLEELTSEFPDDPDLQLRVRQLEGESSEEAAKPIALGPPETVEVIEDEPASGGNDSLFQDLKIELAREMSADDGAATGSADESTRSTTQRGGSSGAPGAPARAAELAPDLGAVAGEAPSGEDFETHFNLGIAYREMELLDDAINEFQRAFKALTPSKSPKDVIRCCGMLSTCFLEKSMPNSTIRWCQIGLAVENISPHETMALRYDLASAHAQVGEPDKALESFSFIFDLDPGYRDVAQRIDDLRGQS